MKTRADPSRTVPLERNSMGSCHRSAGCELVIAGFRLRLTRRPRRRGIIFWFSDISKLQAGKFSLSFLRRVGREPCGTIFGDAPSVIADFQREASWNRVSSRRFWGRVGKALRYQGSNFTGQTIR